MATPRLQSFLSASALVAAVFLLPACLGGESSLGSHGAAGASSGTQSATAGTPGGFSATGLGGHGSTGAGGRTAQPIPSLTYPEQRYVRMERTIWFVDVRGVTQGMRDQLLADGQGSIRLDVLQVWDPTQQAWTQPTADHATWYADHSHWNALYRDVHLGWQPALESNYDWSVTGQKVIAGRLCTETTAVNHWGQGDVVLYHDPNDADLLLGWTLKDESGNLQASLETTLIEGSPDLNGVTWPAPPSGGLPWNGPVHDPLVGNGQFGTFDPTYLPAGSYLVKREYLPSSAVMVLPAARWDEYADGIRRFVMVQFVGMPDPNNPPASLPVAVQATKTESWDFTFEAALADGHSFWLRSTFPQNETLTVMAGFAAQ